MQNPIKNQNKLLSLNLVALQLKLEIIIDIEEINKLCQQYEHSILYRKVTK